MEEFVGIITKEDYLSDDLIKDVIFIIGGHNPKRLGESGCEFYFSKKSKLYELETVRLLKVDLNIISSRNREKKILVADMDSTLINEECIDELAKLTNMSKKILEITDRSMNGEISFSDSIIERTLLFRGISSKILEDCFNQCISLSNGARTLINTMNSRNSKTYIISGGYNYFVSRIAKILNVSDYISNDVEIENGKFSGILKKPIIDEIAKLNEIKKICKTSNLNLKDVIAVGDGANDMKMLKSVDLGVAYRSKEIVKSATNIHLDFSDLTALLFLQGIDQKQFYK